MARQTRVDALSDDLTKGRVQITIGSQVGDNTRTVSLVATPLPGFVFKEWQIEEFPLIPLTNVNFLRRFNTQQQACAGATSDSPIGNTFYKDQNTGVLYIDSEGTQLVESGYWYLGNFTYAVVSGNLLTSIGTCTGSGDGEGDGGDDGIGDGEGDVVTPF